MMFHLIIKYAMNTMIHLRICKLDCVNEWMCNHASILLICPCHVNPSTFSCCRVIGIAFVQGKCHHEHATYMHWYKCCWYSFSNQEWHGHFVAVFSYLFSYTTHVVKFVNHSVWEQGELAGAHGPRARSPVISLHIGTPCPRSLWVG